MIISAGTLLQFRIWCQMNNQASVNTLHWQCQTASGPVATDAQMLAVLEPIYAPLWKQLINNNATYQGMTLQVISPPIGLLQKRNLLTGVGTGGATAVATQTSGLIDWGTGLGGRKYRGRTYFPFPSTSEDGSLGFPDTGYLIGLDAIGTEYINHTSWTINSGAQTIVPVVVHRKDKTGVVSPPTQLISWQSVAAWATQKKRGYFGRPNVSPF